MAHDVFISYSTKDKVTADAICHVLEQNKIKCWIAPRNITSGKPYADEIMDAITTTKIVVLVFSSNAQASQFVQKEIDIAFSNSRPILSYKIDESMPEREFEYYLKVAHWLEAYPEPENTFSTLVKDASKLVGNEKTNPIVDSDVMVKARNGEFNHVSIKKHWKSLILLCTPLYSISLIYMGLSSKMKELAIEGAICLVPLALYIYYKFTGSFIFNLAEVEVAVYFIIILWIIALIYVFLIRKDYALRKTIIGSVSDDKELLNALIDEYMDV